MADLKMDQDMKDAMVEMLKEIPVIAKVCKTVGVGYDAFHKARKKDPEFDAAVKEALDIGWDLTEAEAHRRAVRGVREDIFFKGEKIGEKRLYSDSLLKFLLKGRKPKRYNPGVHVRVDDDDEKFVFNFNMGSED
jgi:hypothetical protein